MTLLAVPIDCGDGKIFRKDSGITGISTVRKIKCVGDGARKLTVVTFAETEFVTGGTSKQEHLLETLEAVNEATKEGTAAVAAGFASGVSEDYIKTSAGDQGCCCKWMDLRDNCNSSHCTATVEISLTERDSTRV